MDETTSQVVVGRRGKRRDQEEKPIGGTWGTDLIGNQDPDYVYQWFREDEVRQKLQASRLRLTDYETGDVTAHDLPGWTVCQRSTGAEEAQGWRPDEGKPLDTVLRHGPHVCMKLKREYFALLERAQEQRADGYEQRLRGGAREEFNTNGDPVRATGARVAAGNVRIVENPLGRI